MCAVCCILYTVYCGTVYCILWCVLHTVCCVLCAVWYCMLTHVLWLSFVLVAFAAAKLTNNPQRAGAVNVVVPEGVNKMVISDGVTLQAGAVYYREPVGVQSGFTTSFTVEYVMYKIS